MVAVFMTEQPWQREEAVVSQLNDFLRAGAKEGVYKVNRMLQDPLALLVVRHAVALGQALQRQAAEKGDVRMDLGWRLSRQSGTRHRAVARGRHAGGVVDLEETRHDGLNCKVEGELGEKR